MLYSHRQKKLYISALFTITKFVRRRTLFSLFSINRLKLITIGTLVLTIVSASILTSGIAAFLPNNSIAMAAPTTQTNKSLDWKVQSYIYYKALGLCIGNAALSDGGGFFNRINEQNAKTGNWFSKDGGLGVVTHVTVSPYFRSIPGIGSALDSNNATIDCGSPSLVNGALSLWEYDSPADALCDFGFLRVDYDSASLCKGTLGGGKDFYRPGGTLETFQKAIKKQIYDGAEPKMSDSMLYQYYRGIFNQTCTYKKSSITESLTNKAPDYKFGIYDVPDSGKVPTNKSYYVGAMKRSDMVAVLDIKSPTNLKTMSCSDIESEINNLAEAYSDYRLTHSDEPSGPGSATTDKTRVCKLNPELPECKDAGSSCAIDGIGWIICPVITFAAGVADSMFTVLSDNFLKVGTSIVNTDPSNGPTSTFDAWKIMQSLANVILVIGFLIIIFSQLTGAGVSNYGVKKLLPRLIIVALLINLSFVICQVAVDLSNILGYSLRDFFNGVAADATANSAKYYGASSGNVLGGTNFWTNLGGGILAAGTAIAAGFFVLSMYGTILLAVLLALLMILLILVARQAIIVLFIVIAPIALALYLLPNTEKLTKQWFKIFTNMLLLFPIIALIFGASTLASVILRDSFSSVVPGNDNVNWIGQIIAAGVQILPLFATPLVLKGALNAVPAIGAFASKLSGRANANLRKSIGEGYRQSAVGFGQATRRQARQNYRLEKLASRMSKAGKGGTEGLIGSMYKAAASGQAITGAGRHANKSLTRTALAVADKADNEEVGAAETQMRTGVNPTELLGHAQSEMIKATRSGDSVKARAAQRILLAGGGKGIDKLEEAYREIESGGRYEKDEATGTTTFKRTGTAVDKGTESMQHLRSALNAAGLKPKNSILATWAFNGVTLEETSTVPKENPVSGLSDVELAGQRDPVLDASIQFITQEKAQSIIKNENVFKDLSPHAKEIFNAIAAGRTPEVTTSTQPTVGSAKETIATAAAGTSGTVTFDVNSSGRVTPGTPETRFDVRQEDISRGTESSGDNTFVVDRSGTVTEEEFPNFRIDTGNVPPQPRPFSDLNNPPSTTPTPGTPIDPSAIPNLPPNDTPPPNDET